MCCSARDSSKARRRDPEERRSLRRSASWAGGNWWTSPGAGCSNSSSMTQLLALGSQERARSKTRQAHAGASCAGRSDMLSAGLSAQGGRAVAARARCNSRQRCACMRAWGKNIGTAVWRSSRAAHTLLCVRESAEQRSSTSQRLQQWLRRWRQRHAPEADGHGMGRRAARPSLRPRGACNRLPRWGSLAAVAAVAVGGCSCGAGVVAALACAITHAIAPAAQT